jgi:hypothetical protein
MRTLKLWMIIVVMLAVCAPSFGYVLVYNVISRVKAVTDIDSLVGVAVRGYLVLDINESGDVNECYWMTYGKDSTGAKVYTSESPDPILSVNGRYQTFSMDTGDGWSVIVLGKITSKNIGLADKQAIAYTMAGNFVVNGGFVLDGDQLTGSGAMVITLNSTKTKAANQTSEYVGDVVDELTTALGLAGYN